MRVAVSAGAVLLALIVAVLTAATSTMTPALAATALIVGGTKPTNILPDFVMRALLNGYFAGYDARVNVIYPAEGWPVTGILDRTVGDSIQIATRRLHTAMHLTPGAKTVVGISQGAAVVDEVLRRLANDPAAPPKDEVDFVIIASTIRGNGILTFFPKGVHIPILDYTVRPVPETQYDVTVVTSEYDGWADFPDRPWNLVAVANAVVGMVVVHLLSPFADLSKVPQENITVTTNSKGGVTTHYFVESEHLPLLLPLRLVGVPEPLVAAIEEPLRRLVDAGYSRNDSPAVAVSDAADRSAETTTPSFTQPIDAAVHALPEPVDAGAPADLGSMSRSVSSWNDGNPSPPAEWRVGRDPGPPAPDTAGAASPAASNNPTYSIETGGSVATLEALPSAAESPEDAPADTADRGALRTRMSSTAREPADNVPNPFVSRPVGILTRMPGRATTKSGTTTTNTSTTSTDTTSTSSGTGEDSADSADDG